MSTPTPTPEPDVTPAQEAFREALPDGAFDTLWDEFYAAYSEFKDKVPGWRAFFTDHHQSALDNSLRVLAGMLDLPARDARIRSATAREVAEDIAAAIESHDPTAIQAARTARYHATQYDAPAVRPVEPSAVPAEGSGQGCPSRIAHESGDPDSCVCYPCLVRRHRREELPVATEGSGHPRPFVECLLPIEDGWCVSPTGHEGPCSPTRPVLSLDTPEGATNDH